MTKFLVIRFSPGSAGKMLTSILSFHPEIISWNNTVQSDYNWFTSHYPGKFVDWLDTEPKNPWNIQKYYSAEYPRGDNLESLPIDFPNLWIPVNTHKLHFARWMKDCHCVTIILDKPSLKWFYRSKWKKRFRAEKTESGYKIIQQQHRANYQFGTHNNQYIVETNNLYRFIRNTVIDDKLTKQYLDQNNYKQGTIVKLSELLDRSEFRQTLDRVIYDMGLTTYNWPMVDSMWKHWRELHDY